MHSFLPISNLTGCRIQEYNYERFERTCSLALNDTTFKNNTAQNFLISINETKQNISFIYYELSEYSKICRTKTENMPDILINVHYPDESFQKELNISCESCKNVATKYFNNTCNQYNLTFEDDDILQSPLSLYIKNDQVIHNFNLKEMDLNLFPKYNFYLASN